MSAQTAAATEYDAAMPATSVHSANEIFRAAMDDADKRHAAAVAESVAIRMHDFEEAWRDHQHDHGYVRSA